MSRIWNMIEWTKPHRQEANIILTDVQKEVASDSAQIGCIFQEQFTPSNSKLVDKKLIEDMEQKPLHLFRQISTKELRESLQKTSNFSAPEPDNMFWFWLKKILRNESGPNYNPEISDKKNMEVPIAAYYNVCINYTIQLQVFKILNMVVIAKPNRPDYTKAKVYKPIVLLNCLGKLMKKIIAHRMQFESQKYGILHLCQFGGTIQHSMADAGIQLVHNV